MDNDNYQENNYFSFLTIQKVVDYKWYNKIIFIIIYSPSPAPKKTSQV